MTFDEWVEDNVEFLHESTIVGDLRLAYNAGMKADVHTDNEKTIASMQGIISEAEDLLSMIVYWSDVGDRKQIDDYVRKAEDFLERRKGMSVKTTV